MKNVWTARKYSLLLTKYWHHEDFIWQWWCAGDCCQIWLLMGENDLVFCFWLLDRHCVPNISMPHGWHWKHTHTHTQSCVFIRNWNQNPWITILFFLISILILSEYLLKIKSIILVHESTKDHVLTYKCDEWIHTRRGKKKKKN